MPTKKINLISGGAGFIGSHLTDFLMERDEKVICLDNLYTGGKQNIAKWLTHQNFEFINHDILEPINLEVDRIWHLACPASPLHYQFDPIKTTKTCFIGTLNMLDLAKRVGAKILFASTSEIYGNPKVHPQGEDYWGNVNPIGIRSCYDEGKRIAETLCFDYKRSNNIEVSVARIFNTYGPRMMKDDGRVVSNFINQVISNKPLTIYGNGLQTRSFCYVDDLVRGLVSLMNSKETGPINLGNPDEYKIIDIANKIISITKASNCVEYKPLPQDDPLMRKPNIKLAQKKLNWSPKIQINEGLKKTINYYRNNK